MKTGIIIQARIGSTRLPKKALIKINGIESLEYCIDACKHFHNIDEMILATTFDNEDMLLKRFCSKNMLFYRGSKDDLIMRYYGAAQLHEIDTIIRVTGDNPVVSPEIGKILLESHMKTGADYTEAESCAIGTGCQAWKTDAFSKLLELGIHYSHSEHMGFFMVSNPDIFKVNRVKLPNRLVRNYRLTLDYSEDLEMFNQLFEKMEMEDLNPLKLKDVFSCLENYPWIAKTNHNCVQQYDTELVRARLKKENERIRATKKSGIKMTDTQTLHDLVYAHANCRVEASRELIEKVEKLKVSHDNLAKKVWFLRLLKSKQNHGCKSAK